MKNRRTGARARQLICWSGPGIYLALVLLSAICVRAQQPTLLGDLDADGQITVIDLQKLLNHLTPGKDEFHLVPNLVPYADVNEDGYLNQSDVTMLRDAVLGIPLPVNTRPVALEPATGSGDVGVTVRPKALFPKPIDLTTLNSNNFYATFAGRRLAATITPAANGTFAWLFFRDPMPGASQIQVTVDGNTLRTRTGLPLDADGDGALGGIARFNFSTVSVAPIPGTVLSSRVVDPGPDLIPRTADDVVLAAGYQYLLPIAGVKVYVLGMESNFTFTDANGRFTLTNVPVGNVKVALDGRTATNAPDGYYFPEMVMDTTFEPGITNGVMNIVDANGNVVRDANGVPMRALAMYLPRVASNVLQTVSATNTTVITLNSNAAYDLPTNQQQYLTIEVQPGSLIGLDGRPVASGQVGVSVVPPELVRDMLPPGLLQHTFDITVQAPGIATFATPAPMTFPNVFNAPPGTQLSFLSFDHTTGRLVFDGTATVSADGLYVATDPGTGITRPGWHGLAPPGTNVGPPGGTPASPPSPPGPPQDTDEDGVPDSEDSDDDNDGTPDDGDDDDDGDGTPDSQEDTDQDGSPDINDSDDDNDGMPDTVDQDDDGDGVPDSEEDSDGDGMPDVEDMDDDNDGTLDDGDADDDGNGIPDDQEEIKEKQVDFDFISDREGGQRLDGYVPASDESQSGVTVATGVDLGQRSAEEIRSMDIPDSLKEKLVPYAGLTKDEAVEFLKMNPLTLTDAEAGALDKAVKGPLLAELERRYNADSAIKFADLSPEAQTVIASVGYQYGALWTETPNFWTQVTMQQWDDAVSNLRDFGDVYDTRRNLEADLLENVLERTRPATDNVSPRPGGQIVGPQLPVQIGPQLPQFQLRRSAENIELVAQIEPHFFGVFNLDRDEFEVRGFSDGGVALEGSVFLAANARYRLFVVQPRTQWMGYVDFVTPSSGGNVSLGNIRIGPIFGADSDMDGLANHTEFILGTDPSKPDSDGDGISDGAEIRQGLDPFGGRAFPTGVVASLPLPGEAKEVVLEGSILDRAQQTAYLALGSRGLGIVNASEFQKPILLGQLDLPGDATDVAVDSNLRIAAVAANAGGLHLVNVADPMQPALLQTIPGTVNQVGVINGVAYAGFGASIRAYDLLTGELLETLDLNGGTITGLAREGFFLYSMDSSRRLRVIDLSGPNMATRGTLTMPSGGGKLFVGGGVAYVAAGNGNTGGFATADVSNPANLTLISGVDANNVQGQAVVANGSGLAIGVGRVVFFPAGPATTLDVLNASDPANTGAFVTRFNLSTAPFSVAIGSGIAFVAVGTAGLQVVNYRSFDNQGVPPVLNVVPPADMDPAPGIQVEEGGVVQVGVQVTDDVQVRNVELLFNGQVVVNDVSFPWDLSARMPLLSSRASNATLQVRATDTGGNSTTSAIFTVTLVPDHTPPVVRRVTPASGAIAGSINLVGAYFSEPVDESTLGGTLTLTWAGVDDVFATGDDVVITDGTFTYHEDLRAVFLSFSTNLFPGVYRASVSPPVRDLAGNTLAQAATWQFWVIGGQDTDHDGIPDTIELALGLDPNNPDSNGNGISDGDEDLDGDGLRNKFEVFAGLDPRVKDSDGNGIFDGAEDFDLDGLTNLQEQQFGTDPRRADSDGDGWNDETEVTTGSNPLSAASRPFQQVMARPPVRVVLPTLADPNLPANTTVARPPVAVLLPNLSDPGLPANTFLARPPVQVVLPTLAGSDLPANTTVARPPVGVLLPNLSAPELPANTFLARPPVSALLPSFGDANLPANTTVGQPPVKVKFDPQ